MLLLGGVGTAQICDIAFCGHIGETARGVPSHTGIAWHTSRVISAGVVTADCTGVFGVFLFVLPARCDVDRNSLITKCFAIIRSFGSNELRRHGCACTPSAHQCMHTNTNMLTHLTTCTIFRASFILLHSRSHSSSSSLSPSFIDPRTAGRACRAFCTFSRLLFHCAIDSRRSSLAAGLMKASGGGVRGPEASTRASTAAACCMARRRGDCGVLLRTGMGELGELGMFAAPRTRRVGRSGDSSEPDGGAMTGGFVVLAFSSHRRAPCSFYIPQLAREPRLLLAAPLGSH